MNSNNTILALAYIRESSNPLKVFCNMIAYCLYLSPNKILRNDELLESVKSEFGLILPYHLINTCVRLMRAEKQLEMLSHGAGYKLIQLNFDAKKFDDERRILKEKEEKLLNNLISFVKGFGKAWTQDDARSYLTKFLVENENAYYLFVNGYFDKPKEDTKKYISPNWYIKKYISLLIEKQNSDYNYLLEIVKGLMIYLGLNQTDDYLQEKKQKFKGTSFFLDTKLILRILGYSWKAAVQASRELADIIKNEYEGEICIFDHTISEVENALSVAANGLLKSNGIENPELRAFRALNNFSAEDFRIAAKSVRNTIQEVYKYKIEPDTEWNNDDTRKYNLDWEKLYIYIKSQHPTWKEVAIKNDISSINKINIYRCGDYTIKYGGKKKLPIFVTTNYPLIKDVKDFVINCISEEDCSTNWNIRHLPIISDNLLMCRLWLPKASNYSDLPVLTLARTVFSVQQADVEFYERVKVTAKDVSLKHKYNVIDLSDERNEKLKEILAIKSDGDLEKIDTEMVASSFEELIKFETLADKENIKKLTEEKNENEKLLKDTYEELIVSYSNKYIDKLGIAYLLIIFAKYWWAVSAVLVVAITSLSNYFTIHTWFSKYTALSIVPVLIPYFLKIIDRFSNNSKTATYIETYLVNIAKERYLKRIKKRLTKESNTHKEDVISYCLSRSKIFNSFDQ